MNALVCEMCGGSNLIKQEGVFVCQNCKTKYSVEEAKRMMIEGVVDVSGSTVKVDNSAKLENLYKVARRASDDGDSDRALKSYEQLQLEDPNNWEPAFYSAFYTGLDSLKNDNPGGSVRISGGQVTLSYAYRSGISPCISRIQNCIDSVFSLIEDIEDYDTQKSAIDSIKNDVSSIAQSLNGVIETEHARMKNEISHYIQEVHGNESIVFKNIEKSNMNSQNNRNRDSYKKDVSDMVNLVENMKTRLEEVVGKRRFDEYWGTHQSEKVDLESEKQSLLNQIASLENDIKIIPGYAEMVEQSKQHQLLEVKKSSLGVFKGKEKKAIQAQMDSINNYVNQVKENIKPAIENIKNQIQPLEARVNAIETELTKPR